MGISKKDRCSSGRRPSQFYGNTSSLNGSQRGLWEGVAAAAETTMRGQFFLIKNEIIMVQMKPLYPLGSHQALLRLFGRKLGIRSNQAAKKLISAPHAERSLDGSPPGCDYSLTSYGSDLIKAFFINLPFARPLLGNLLARDIRFGLLYAFNRLV